MRLTHCHRCLRCRHRRRCFCCRSCRWLLRSALLYCSQYHSVWCGCTCCMWYFFVSSFILCAVCVCFVFFAFCISLFSQLRKEMLTVFDTLYIWERGKYQNEMCVCVFVCFFFSLSVSLRTKWSVLCFLCCIHLYFVHVCTRQIFRITIAQANSFIKISRESNEVRKNIQKTTAATAARHTRMKQSGKKMHEWGRLRRNKKKVNRSEFSFFSLLLVFICLEAVLRLFFPPTNFFSMHSPVRWEHLFHDWLPKIGSSFDFGEKQQWIYSRVKKMRGSSNERGRNRNIIRTTILIERKHHIKLHYSSCHIILTRKKISGKKANKYAAYGMSAVWQMAVLRTNVNRINKYTHVLHKCISFDFQIIRTIYYCCLCRLMAVDANTHTHTTG